MGKDKKVRTHKVGLAEDIIDEQTAKPQKQRSKGRKERQAEKDESYVGEKLSKRILEQARKQQDELEEEFGCGPGKKSLKTAQTSLGGVGRPDDDDVDSGDDGDDSEDASEAYEEQVEIAEEDEKSFEKFMSKEAPARRTLADIIMEKINEKKTEIQSHMSEKTTAPKMDERLVKVFRGVGNILKSYRSGKLPKAFKVIPSLKNWEDVMHLTEPDQWSAAAIYQGTKLFTVNANPKMAQRFFNLVLYPRIRDDIAEYKRLNYHLYMSLKKALFKPAAFFKGILLPLCEAGDCSLREAIIVGSILSKTSIPVLHSSAVILKIAEMNYSGANSIFLKTFFDKKYTMPYRVIDAVVYHFLRFLSDQRTLPVLWHQCLLTFIQRYKEDISSEQKETLLELCKVHLHTKITPDVRRELINSKCRDEETDLPMEGTS